MVMLMFQRMRKFDITLRHTYALLCRISLESLGALAPEGGSVIEAAGVEAAGFVLALVEAAAVGVGVAPGPRRTLAHVSSVLVDAPGPGTARVTQTLVQVNTLKKICLKRLVSAYSRYLKFIFKIYTLGR